MRTHVALWAAMKTPLLIGSNVKNLTQDDVNVLKNRCLLAFNQDDEYGEPSAAIQMGRQPPRGQYDSANPAEFWTGASSIGHLVLMMNVRDDKTTKTAIWNEVPGLQK
ncbi:putative alpha-galactosidase B [Beauveria bassiana]|nr:putative alpha-galactosidase B [Beauveria bassiana]KAH8713175.1 putative alpha-galactosidase B [Beauveria bassiana]